MVAVHEVIMILVSMQSSISCSLFFFFNDTATTEIYTLSLHDALPIYQAWIRLGSTARQEPRGCRARSRPDRKSTRLNSSHLVISYAVFCLKKKNTADCNYADPANESPCQLLFSFL